jgi:predicted dehydrogenase
MMAMSVNVGIVGCGGIANRHMGSLSRMPEAKMVAFCDIDYGRAKASADRYGGRAYGDYRDMLARERLDAIFVCVPPFARGFEVEFVERGINLFVEKPVALNLEVASRIEKAIAKAGVINSVGYMWRYYDTTDRAREAIEGNGPMGFLEGHYVDPFWFPSGHWWLRKERGGGQVVEQATHVFDLTRYFAGDVERVYTEMDRRIVTWVPEMNVEDIAITTLRFRNGAIGVIVNTCASKRTLSYTELRIFSKDVVVEHGCHRGYVKLYTDLEVREFRPSVDPYMEEAKVFLNAVMKGDQSGIRSSFKDAVKTLQVTLAANEAALEKKVITLT